VIAMKRFVSLFLALMLSLTACGANTTAAGTKTVSSAQGAETAHLAAQTGSFSDVPAGSDYC